ncbi:MAG: DNA gyrase subunit A [Candidatus Acidoferrales bacterium]
MAKDGKGVTPPQDPSAPLGAGPQVPAFIPVDIEDEMRRSYMDYAMSVIIGRALPDGRDGLKPVHRRILYAMHEMNLTPGRKHSKCAGVVGEVLKKFHPHGDAPVYEALVRMAQEFNMRYVLIEGQGNFGSVDGDPPAAYRYTECRLDALAMELLADIEKETVDFSPNFDDTTEEPQVLPARVPNLVVNGASGIAVGMATNIPPHNLAEVLDACALLIRKPNATLKEIMQLVPGPDFPTGGYLFGLEGIAQAYGTGRGSFQVRAKAAIEEAARDKQNIIITEIPYQVNKARLIEKIADLVTNKRIEGIGDIRDESDREGMRIVLELKRGEQPEIILNNLYKHTQMQVSFGMIMLAIVNGQPKEMGLIEALQLFIAHRVDVVRRRTQFELTKARQREHILLGFKKALQHLDAIIKLIRRSKSPAEAKTGLMRRWQFTDVQAQGILDLQLHRLTQLEREKILAELKAIQVRVKELEEILASETRLRHVITEELREVQKKYGDERRTQIVGQVEEIRLEDLVPDEEVIVTVTHSGYLKRMPVEAYRHQGRGGKGRMALKARADDFVEHLFVASTHGYLLVFTHTGKVYWLRVWDLPESGWQSRGKAITNLVKLEAGEQVAAFLAVKSLEEADRYVFFCTRNGTVKKTELSQFATPRSTGIYAVGLEQNDELVGAKLTDGKHLIFLASHNGWAIVFRESDVRAMGRQAYGVRGMKLDSSGKKGRQPDTIVGMAAIAPESEGLRKALKKEVASLEEVPDEALKKALPDDLILTVTEQGHGKRTRVADYRLQSRGGKGVINIKVAAKNGPVAGVALVPKDSDAVIVTQHGKIIRVRTKQIRSMGRSARGVRLLRMEEGDRVAACAAVIEEEEASAAVEAASEAVAE